VGDHAHDGLRSEAGAEQAFQFLVRVSSTFDEQHDLTEALQALAQLTVPALGDTCTVEVKADDGSIETLATATASEHETGTAPSTVEIPMKYGGRVLGTLTLASFSPERTWEGHERVLIEEVARRAAIRIENARLSAERALLARTLRESLLPPRLPDLVGAEVAARFHPAASLNEVSGDFYDVFAVDNFDWMIVIGDVSGRGVEAAATTALARHTIRAAALHGASPKAALEILNEALLAQLPELRPCTVLVGLLAIGGAGARLTIANGGHPAPLRLHADGMVEPVTGSGTLLGVLDEPQLEEADVNLAIGDSVVFYTDGVTEVRRNGRGVEDLASVVGGCVDLDATITAASIDQALLEPEHGHLRDDAVILVLRILEPEDDLPGDIEKEPAERERSVRGRRLAWSRWAGRGGGSDQQPSSGAGRSGPR
jgi:serine phosphatase RsbU (regulator of sigma subunit)